MILILGGTSDATAIAKALYELTDKIIVSTATEYGFQATDKEFRGEIIWGRKDLNALTALLRDRGIHTLIDATHPFAGDVSENAIKACGLTGVAYIRYERPASEADGQHIRLCDTYEDAGEAAERETGTVFITTGSRHAGKILSCISDQSRVRVRILPVSESILEIERLGLKAEQIIAMKGPFSEEMNYLMMKECQAAVMICKDSGAQGGTEEKIKAARRLGIKAIMIRRPAIEYPNRYGSISELLQEVGKRRT